MSSIGIVKILIPKFSLLLYHTIGDSIPVPVSTPFTMKKGSNKKIYVK